MWLAGWLGGGGGGGEGLQFDSLNRRLSCRQSTLRLRLDDGGGGGLLFDESAEANPLGVRGFLAGGALFRFIL